jgi:uncharacterized protein YbjT (DUF2867 family)
MFLMTGATGNAGGAVVRALVADGRSPPPVHFATAPAGVSWARIGEFIGQRNLAVTANTYTHVLLDESELDYAELLLERLNVRRVRRRAVLVLSSAALTH